MSTMRWVAVLVALVGCDHVLGLTPAIAIDADLPPPPGTWASVAIGEDHSCALRTDGSLYCWGNNLDGELGQGTQGTDLGDPTQVSGTWLAIGAGGFATCAIRDDHSLWCWGQRFTTGLDVVVPTMLDPGPWSSLAVGATHACALAPDGTASCWGIGSFGELGDGLGAASTPDQVMTTMKWTAIAAGYNHTCAIAKDDASLWCWGQGLYGQLGVGTTGTNNALTPRRVDGESWIAVTAGGLHTCGILGDGGLRCWGNDAFGEIGADLAGGVMASTPVAVAADQAPWTAVAAGSTWTCAVRGTGELWCWGNNGSGQLGAANEGTSHFAPTPVAGGAHSWTSVAAGVQATCGLGDDHNMWCFGATRLGSTANVSRPAQVTGNWQRVHAGNSATCALDDTGGLACWGRNSAGELGDASYIDRDSPTAVGAAPWIAVAITDELACGIAGGGVVSCWGTNPTGLGDGSTMRTIPTAIATGPFTDVSVGSEFACAVAAGTLSCWGDNTYGELASGNTNPSPMPGISPSYGGMWTSVTAGASHACGLVGTDVYCWGDNTDSEIGNGMPGPVTTPAHVIAADRVSAGFATTCAIAAGSATCWGDNRSGQIGDGTTSTRPLPTPLDGTWRDVSPGKDHACGIRGDGSMWCWGDDSSSQLGDGLRAPQLAPVEIDPGDWQQVSAGWDHTCAIKTDHSLWCWGGNVYGQLGLGTSTFGKPVFVP